MSKNLRYFVTGGAGFIGSNFVDRLLSNGNEVVIYDNFSTGFEENLRQALKSAKCIVIKDDLLNSEKVVQSMSGCDFVIHLAANADVRSGTQQPHKDIEQNTIVTFNVLEGMRKNNIKKIVFSSTGSIYGEPEIFPTPETAPFPVQTSLYGASKLACEGLIEAYCEGFGFQSWIFRFVSILGERYSHGHVIDFYRALLNNPDELHILGDGHQKKSYLYVQDCIDAVLFAVENSSNKSNIFNLGTNEYCEVNDSIKWICKYLNVNPKLSYSGGKRGWVGDSPFIFLDISRLNVLGWEPKFAIKESIIKTLVYLQKN